MDRHMDLFAKLVLLALDAFCFLFGRIAADLIILDQDLMRPVSCVQ